MFEDIQVFCAIARQKSFAKAARELNLSTPVVTRRLARLEQHLNTRLLNRSTRQVLLTEAGGRFYNEVNEIMQALEASKESLKNLNQNIIGTLKVGLPISFSEFYVTKALHRFMEKHPHLNIHIQTGNNLFHLLNEGYDLIVHCGAMPNSSYHYKKIGSMDKILCASPAYLAKYGNPKTIAELQHHQCLGMAENFHHTWSLWENDKIVNVLVKGRVSATNGIDLMNLTLNGLGIGHLPYYLIHEALEKGQLIPILENNQTADYALYAVYPTDKYLNKKTQLFREFMADLLKKVCRFEGCEYAPCEKAEN